jgi:hypothetical protein
MLFAHLKRILKLDRLRLRGPTGARVMTGSGSVLLKKSLLIIGES